MEEVKATQEETEEVSEEETGTPTNPDEGGVPSETTPEGGQETPEEPDKVSKELEEKNKQLFERAKKAEAKVKILESQKPKVGTDQIASADPIELAKTVSALKDYSPDELDYIQLIAKGKGLPLDEVVKTDEVKTYIEAKRLKVESEKKTPEPSSPSSVIGEKTEEERENMTDKEYAKFLKDDIKKSPGGRSGI